ncbi:MAG: hypothetical protein ACRD4B_03050, partial [Acidobacteriota bacterium]
RALGRVTTKIALGWTEQQWTDNAQWARDVLAARGIKRVSKRQIARLASAGLTPNLHAIREVWTGLPNYRKKTGIEIEEEKRLTKEEVKNWDKSKFKENGLEYAEYLGRKIGFPRMPTKRDIRRGSKEDRTPNVWQIVNDCDSIPEYQELLGFVNHYVVKKWTDQQWKDNFDWLKDVWAQYDREITSLKELLDIAGRLHIGPSVRDAERRWRNLTNYAKHVGYESDLAKRSLSNEGVLRAAMQTVAKQKSPLNETTAEEDPILSMRLSRRFGGVGGLNFRLGIITDTRGWDKNMLLWWGVTSFMPQASRLPQPEDLKEWRDTYRGPSTRRVYKEFDQSLEEFHSSIEAAQEWLANQVYRFVRPYRREVPHLYEPLLRQAIKRNHKLFHPGRDIEPNELDSLYQLQTAGVDLRFITMVMQTGISFSDPEPRLMELAEVLSSRNLLNSAMLRRLETYIIGLAPPKVEMSWTDFIADYRKQNA